MIIMLQLIAGLVGCGIIICMKNQQAKVKAEAKIKGDGETG